MVIQAPPISLAPKTAQTTPQGRVAPNPPQQPPPAYLPGPIPHSSARITEAA